MPDWESHVGRLLYMFFLLPKEEWLQYDDIFLEITNSNNDKMNQVMLPYFRNLPKDKKIVIRNCFELLKTNDEMCRYSECWIDEGLIFWNNLIDKTPDTQ